MSSVVKSSVEKVRKAIAELIGNDGLLLNAGLGRLVITTSKQVNVPGYPQIARNVLSSIASGALAQDADAPDLKKPKGRSAQTFDQIIAQGRLAKKRAIQAIGDVGECAIVRNIDGTHRWKMILPDASEPGHWRTQAFDEKGFFGHATFASKELAIEEAAVSGYSVRDDGALDRIQDTPAFQRGIFVSDLIRQVNSQQITHNEAEKRLAIYDESLSTLHSVREKGAQAFITADGETIYLLADRIVEGTEQAVFLHEITHRYGKRILGQHGLDRHVATLNKWAQADAGSIERRIHDRAIARAKFASRAKDGFEQVSALFKEEFIAYGVEEAVRLGVKPSAMAHAETAAGWLQAVCDTLRSVINIASNRVLNQGCDALELTPQMLVDLAYAMAQLDSPQRMQRIIEGLTDDERLRFQSLVARQGMPKWYSPLQIKVRLNPQTQMLPWQWAQWIEALKTKGVKSDEIEWSGVLEWLKLQEVGVPLTKWDVQGFLEVNGVRVQDTVFSGDGFKTIYEVRTHDGVLKDAFDDEYDAECYIDNQDLYGDATVVEKKVENESAPKYVAHTFPEGKNNREILLTLPANVIGLDVEPLNRRLRAAKFDALYRDQLQILRTGGADAIAMLEELTEILGVDTTHECQQLKQGKKLSVFETRHWEDVPNVLAHVRVNDRLDSQGAKVLFVEEIQSDWGQILTAKAKLAAKRDERIEKMLKEFGGPVTRLWAFGPDVPATWSYWWMGRNVPTAATSRLEALREQRKEAEIRVDELASHVDVPDGPLVGSTDAWVSLAIKRVFKLAADEGYDKVVFIDGTQSADRYGHRKPYDSFHYAKEKGWLVGRSGDEVGMLKWDVTPDELVKHVGHEIARELLSSPVSIADADANQGMQEKAVFPDGTEFSEVKGLKLKLGGRGMMEFYDRIVPKVTKTLLKKLDDSQSLKEFGLDGPGGAAAYKGFDVTPKMRASASLGMPMFSIFKDSKAGFRQWAQDLPIAQNGASDYVGGPAIFEAFHGTTHTDIVEFKTIGAKDGFLGQGPYFTTSATDASSNYAGIGPDLTARINSEVDSLCNEIDTSSMYDLLTDYFEAHPDVELPEGWSEDADSSLIDETWGDHGDDAARFKVKSDLKGDSDGLVMKVYVKLANPADTTVKGEYLTYSYTTDGEGAVENEEGTLVDWIMAARSVAEGYNVNIEEYVDALLEDRCDVAMDDVFNISLKHLTDFMDDMDGTPLTGGAVFREIAEAAGYDGVIMSADMHFGSGRRGFGGVRVPSMTGVDHKTLHIVPFNASQVKSFTGNNGDFDASSPDIRYSMQTTLAATSTSDVKDWFNGEKAVDGQGRPRVVYHNTPSANAQSITKIGIVGSDATSPGGVPVVFVSDTYTPREGMTTFAIDASELALDEDSTTEPPGAERWFAVYGDIKPSQIKGSKKGFVEPAVRGPAIQTPAFKAWFGDSKVVDGEGKPLVVYHGTGLDFSSFSKEHQGRTFKHENLDVPDDGFWFATDPDRAHWYASKSANAVKDGAQRLIPVYLQLKNPYIHTAQQFADEGLYGLPDLYMLEKQGYDGVIIERGEYGQGDDWATVQPVTSRDFAVFNPNQIKSAIGNNGEYSRNTADIRCSLPHPDDVSSEAPVGALVTDDTDEVLMEVPRHAR